MFIDQVIGCCPMPNLYPLPGPHLQDHWMRFLFQKALFCAIKPTKFSLDVEVQYHNLLNIFIFHPRLQWNSPTSFTVQKKEKLPHFQKTTPALYFIASSRKTHFYIPVSAQFYLLKWCFVRPKKMPFVTIHYNTLFLFTSFLTKNTP